MPTVWAYLPTFVIVENLLQVVRRDLRAQDVAGLDGVFEGAQELGLMGRQLERYEVRKPSLKQAL